jgi:hypothetical protein
LRDAPPEQHCAVKETRNLLGSISGAFSGARPRAANADNKKCARLNVIRYLFSQIPYQDLTPEHSTLPTLDRTKYVQPPMTDQNFVCEIYNK